MILDLLPTVRIVSVGARRGFHRFDARHSEAIDHHSLTGHWAPIRQVQQVHGTRILGPGDHDQPADGFELAPPLSAALIQHADCHAVVIADAVTHRAVILHAGWRGAVADITAHGVRRLEGKGARRGGLHVWISAGIGPCCFEVGTDVAMRFPDRFHAGTSKAGRPRLDLGAFLVDRLIGLGVMSHRISRDRRCTRCNQSLHSHRRDGALAGRMATVCIVHVRGDPKRRAASPESLTSLSPRSLP